MPKGRRKTMKGPRAWRKIDISDIKDAAQQRTEDMLAGGKVEDKPSEELFAVTKKKVSRTFSFVTKVLLMDAAPWHSNNSPCSCTEGFGPILYDSRY